MHCQTKKEYFKIVKQFQSKKKRTKGEKHPYILDDGQSRTQGKERALNREKKDYFIFIKVTL